MMGHVVAVIPTHCPERDKLVALVTGLSTTGVAVLISDDGSPCSADPALREAARRGATVIRHANNAGIARGLNDGLRFAEQSTATWLLTLDQDSQLPGAYIPSLLAAADAASASLGLDRVGAVAAGTIGDVSGDLGYATIVSEPVATTYEVIQSGTLWSVVGMRGLGGFDESLGIDAVDAAACLRLRRGGRSIVIAPALRIGHRIGNSRQVSVMGRIVLASGHSPQRRTSMVRNRLRLFPEEFAESPGHALRTLRRVAVNAVLGMTVEEDRWAKARASARGLLPERKR